MQKLLELITDYNFWISFISVFLTILALAYTLYYWLLDHISDDENDFIKEKGKLLSDLKKYARTAETDEPGVFLANVEDVTGRLIILDEEGNELQFQRGKSFFILNNEKLAVSCE